MSYIETFINTAFGTADWYWKSILFQVEWYQNYFWGLILISIIAWILEILFPWRKEQSIFRKDFWLDAFYMFFNFFIFSIFINGFYDVLAQFFNEKFSLPLDYLVLIDISGMPSWAQLLIFFVVLDFVQWYTHVLLHRIPLFWRFHKVHHSVKEMGFAAHLRYHWMENILYKPLKVLGVMLIGGFEPEQAFVVHFFAIAIGHLNHANIRLSYGPLKYIFNNPVMHLYHHAYSLPDNKPHGINFGISLSIWDYIFKTNHVPEDSGTIKLGYPTDENMPKGFLGQITYGFKKRD